MVGPPWQIIEEGESEIPAHLQEFRGGHGHVGAGAGMLVQMQMPDFVLAARAERERALEHFTLYDEQSGKSVTPADMAARLAEVGLRPLSSACVDMRHELETKFEQLQAHVVEAEGLLLLLQGLCAEVSQNSSSLQRDVSSKIEQLQELLEARATVMAAVLRERERVKLSTLHEQIVRTEKVYQKMKRAASGIREMLRNHASMDPVQFMAACRRAGERINPVLIDAAALPYQAEDSADLALTFDDSPEATLLQHTHFVQNKVPAPPKQPRVVKQVKSRTIVKGTGETLDGGGADTGGLYDVTVSWAMPVCPVLCDVPSPVSFILQGRKAGDHSGKPVQNPSASGITDSWITLHDGAQQSFLIRDRRYGERWEFRVSACNECGCGPCSAPVLPFLVGSPLMLEEDKGYSKRDGLRD
jgi:hypothetical protein